MPPPCVHSIRTPTSDSHHVTSNDENIAGGILALSQRSLLQHLPSHAHPHCCSAYSRTTALFLCLQTVSRTPAPIPTDRHSHCTGSDCHCWPLRDEHERLLQHAICVQRDQHECHQRGNNPSRHGVLVRSDRDKGAWLSCASIRGVPSSVAHYYFAACLRRRLTEEGRAASCQPPLTQSSAAWEIRACHRPSLRVLTESHLLPPQTQSSADWGIIRLDRSVPSSVATPVNVGTSQVPVGTPLMMIGHPVGLPRKYAAPPPFVNSDAVLLCSILFHYVILASLTVYVAPPPFVNSDAVLLCSILFHYVILASLTVYVAPPPFVNSDAVQLCSILFHTVILASLTVYVAPPPFVGPYFRQCLCCSSLHLIFALTFPFASNNTHDAQALFTLYH
jgi:hypothetical protein